MLSRFEAHDQPSHFENNTKLWNFLLSTIHQLFHLVQKKIIIRTPVYGNHISGYNCTCSILQLNSYQQNLREDESVFYLNNFKQKQRSWAISRENNFTCLLNIKKSVEVAVLSKFKLLAWCEFLLKWAVKSQTDDMKREKLCRTELCKGHIIFLNNSGT